jgi:hypothetical protein
VRQLIRILVASAIAAGIPAYAATEINYWLWDANRAPSYQACADARDNVPTDIYVGGLVKVWGRGVHWYIKNCKFDIGFAPLPVPTPTRDS